MQPQELLKQIRDLSRIMVEATTIVEGLQKNLSEVEEPAISAQLSVIKHFIHQTGRQEKLLKEMLTAKISH